MSPEDSSCDRLSFCHFDISRLLKHGASLLGSAGAEFELQDDKTGACLILIFLLFTVRFLCLNMCRRFVLVKGQHCCEFNLKKSCSVFFLLVFFYCLIIDLLRVVAFLSSDVISCSARFKETFVFDFSTLFSVSIFSSPESHTAVFSHVYPPNTACS